MRRKPLVCTIFLLVLIVSEERKIIEPMRKTNTDFLQGGNNLWTWWLSWATKEVSLVPLPSRLFVKWDVKVCVVKYAVACGLNHPDTIASEDNEFINVLGVMQAEPRGPLLRNMIAGAQALDGLYYRKIKVTSSPNSLSLCPYATLAQVTLSDSLSLRLLSQAGSHGWHSLWVTCIVRPL